MLKYVALLATAFCLAASATAQEWPSKPLRLIVPYSAGGPTDVIARKIGAAISSKYGQPVVIDNKAGAGGTIGVEQVLNATADGYTLALVAPGPVAGMFALSKVNYAQADIGFISLVARSPAAIGVSAKAGIPDLATLIKTAKERPGKLNFSSAGLGTTPHIGSELFVQEAGIKAVHVAYRGSAPAVTALISGEVEFISTDLLGLLPFARQGQISILAVSSKQRAPQVPNVPTTAELGLPGVVMETNYGVVGPKSLSPELRKRIRGVLQEALDTPDVKTLMESLAVTAQTSSPEEYRDLMMSEYETWRRVAEKGGIRLN